MKTHFNRLHSYLKLQFIVIHMQGLQHGLPNHGGFLTGTPGFSSSVSTMPNT